MRIFFIFAFCLAGFAQTDSKIPPEVRYKSGYVHPAPKPVDFTSAMLWGIAIVDTRVAGYEHSKVEIVSTNLTCRVDGKDIVMNNDGGNVRGGLYRRFPWFGTDEHEPIPMEYSMIPTSPNTVEKWGTPRTPGNKAVVLRVGSRPDRVWHFWAASPRATLPAGHLDGCTATVRARISKGALLQVGFDYWRSATLDYGSGGNNHEAGASDWYFPSKNWQEAMFSDIRVMR